VSSLDKIKELLANILEIDSELVDEIVYSFVLDNIESFLGYYNSLFLEKEEIKKEATLLRRKIKNKLDKHKVLSKIDIAMNNYLLRIAPSRNRDRIYVYLVKDRKRYGPIAEVVATESGLDIWPYNKKISELEGVVNIEELRTNLERLKYLDEFKQIDRLKSKVRTIYELNNFPSTERKLEYRYKEDHTTTKQKKNIIELAVKADKELMQKFANKDIVTREEIEEVLKKYGLSLEEFITVASLNMLEFPSSFYEAEPGKFKKI